jgi:hypothetical protein
MHPSLLTGALEREIVRNSLNLLY